MKSITILIICIILSVNIASAQKMNIHTATGTDVYILSDIDSITFDISAVIPSDGLLAYYPFNGNANDESGNGNDGTILGGATVDQVLVIGQNNIDGLSLPNSIVDGLSNFTFSANLKINTIQVGGGNLGNWWLSCASSGDAYGNSFIVGFIPDSSHWREIIHNESYNSVEDSTLKDLSWHHFAINRNNGVSKIFIDGLQIGNDLMVSDSVITADPNGFILGQEQEYVGGGFQWNQSWAGEIDNFRIYNRALSDAEIYSLYINDVK